MARWAVVVVPPAMSSRVAATLCFVRGAQARIDRHCQEPNTASADPPQAPLPSFASGFMSTLISDLALAHPHARHVPYAAMPCHGALMSSSALARCCRLVASWFRSASSFSHGAHATDQHVLAMLPRAPSSNLDAFAFTQKRLDRSNSSISLVQSNSYSPDAHCSPIIAPNAIRLVSKRLESLVQKRDGTSNPLVPKCEPSCAQAIWVQTAVIWCRSRLMEIRILETLARVQFSSSWQYDRLLSLLLSSRSLLYLHCRIPDSYRRPSPQTRHTTAPTAARIRVSQSLGNSADTPTILDLRSR